MAVYEYGPSARRHASGFVGLRVAVHCCHSGLLQRYWNFYDGGRRVAGIQERRMRRQAADLDRDWRRRQARARQQRTAAARSWLRVGAPTDTGVAGIRMTFAVDRKFRAGRWICYYTPAFVVHGSHGGRRFVRTVRVGPRRVSAGWREAVATYCRHKGITGGAVQKLLRRRPPIARFEMVRQDLRRRLGHRIPPDRVPA